MIAYLPNFLFLLILVIGIGNFVRNIQKLIRNIKLGKPAHVLSDSSRRLRNMLLIAVGQRKMVVRPISGVLHIVVYLGFIIINIEVLEIITDGLLGTHRAFSGMGKMYDFLIGTFEILALLVILAVIIFWIRRNVLKIGRFQKPEMRGWPKRDADWILYIELLLMGLFLTMNAADLLLQEAGVEHYKNVGAFPVSQFLAGIFQDWSVSQLIILERFSWWAHITGILFFLNYLYYSKHLHILLAFPNTYWGKVNVLGKMDNLESVKKEVALMMDPTADPFANPMQSEGTPEKFGASDVMDLNRIQLLNAYSCTECGRCTSECPANQTGKKLSPRHIMMATRDRLEEVGRKLDELKGEWKPDGKQLLDDYISREELWACTSCNACVEACPVSIDPLSIILDMRRYLVMEQSAASSELNVMMTNIENNGAPWPFNPADRLNWAKESD
jgi:heterodisulfide reductase subunit C